LLQLHLPIPPGSAYLKTFSPSAAIPGRLIYIVNIQTELSDMKIGIFIAGFCLLISKNLLGQWEVGAGPGASIPITGYGEVLKTGWLINGDARYRFKKGNFAIGIKAQYVRLQNDKNPADQFQNARMTVAPVIFTAEYSSVKGKLQPYIAGGLGITFFNLNYDTSPTTGETVNNVGFTMMPLIGMRYAASNNIYPFIESQFVLLADGPPIGFPKSDKMTGYTGIIAGVCYRFK